MCEKSRIAALKRWGAPSRVPGRRGIPARVPRGRAESGALPRALLVAGRPRFPPGSYAAGPPVEVRAQVSRRGSGDGGVPRSHRELRGRGRPWERAGRAADTCPSGRIASCRGRIPSAPRCRAGSGEQPRRPPGAARGEGRQRRAWGLHEAAPTRGGEQQGGKHRSSPTCMTELTGVRLSSSPLGPTQNIRIMVSPSSERWTCVDSGSAPGATTIIWGSGETISWRVWTM